LVRASGLRTVEELSEEALRVHARAKLTVLGRRLLVERIVAEGWPVARAAEAQGVSVATAYKWLGRWQSAGEAGLADRSCRPHRSPRRLSPERERAIVEYRRAARVGPHRIGWRLVRPPPRCMRYSARHRLPRLWELDRPTGQVVRYQRQRPGELVHVDIKPSGGSPMGVGIGCWAGARVAPTVTAAMGWALTICRWRWMTALAWPMWRPVTAKTGRPPLGSLAAPWPGSPSWACRSSGS
jgi:hypothetical protein